MYARFVEACGSQTLMQGVTGSMRLSTKCMHACGWASSYSYPCPHQATLMYSSSVTLEVASLHGQEQDYVCVRKKLLQTISYDNAINHS